MIMKSRRRNSHKRTGRPDKLVRDKVIMRNYKWIGSEISAETRALKYKHNAALILITGEKQSPRKELGRALEKQLLTTGNWFIILEWEAFCTE